MSDLHLIIFGLGYTGAAIARLAIDHGFAVTATSRTPEQLAAIRGMRLIAFAEAASAFDSATHLLATAPPPGDDGEGDGVDPVLDRYAALIADASTLRWVGYLSTTGVYGDHAGGWVDETTPPTPGQERSVRRLAAEQAWADLRDDIAVDLFRVAGIYGPGRSPLEDVRAGRARRIIKPGHAFGRIHRDDIAAAVLAAMCQTPTAGVRVFNLNDDEPVETADVVTEAARLLGVEPPPDVPFAEAEARMSPMGRSFWQESRRVSSAATQAALGVRWRYPTYREGLRGILAEELRDQSA